MIVDPRIAVLMAKIGDALNDVFEGTDQEVFDIHGPIQVHVTGLDGVIARFYEEGIDFYPKEEK